MEKGLTIYSKVFEGCNIDMLVKNDGDVLFEIYSVGVAVGYYKKNGSACVQSAHKLYPMKERIDDTIVKADIKPIEIEGKFYMTEGDLNDFIFEAGTAKCKPFKKWITHEVLLDIRKKGYYSVAPIQDERASLLLSIIDAPDAVSTAIAVKNYTTVIEAPLKEEIKNQQEQLALQEPKVEFYDAVTKSDDLLSMKEATDILAIKGYGRNKTLALLRFKKIFNERNIPYRQYTDKGYFAVKEHDYTTKFGNVRHNSTTYVTHKGLEFLRKVILKDMENKEDND